MCISYGTTLLNWIKEVQSSDYNPLRFAETSFYEKNTGNHKDRFTWLNQRDWLVYRFYHDASEILPVRGLIWRSMNDAKILPDIICVVRCRVQNSRGYFCLFFFYFRGHWDRIPVRHLRYHYGLTHVLNRQLRSLKTGARWVLNMQKYAIGQICGENLQLSSGLCGSRVTVHLELNIVQSLGGIRERWSINNFCLHWPWPAICINYLTNDSSVKVDRLDYNLRL